MLRRKNQKTRTRRTRRSDRKLVACNADPQTRVPSPRTIPMNRSLVIQMRQFLTCTTSGTTLNSYLAFDPSSTTTAAFGSNTLFGEWAYVSALFARVKILQFDISMSPAYIDDTKGDIFDAIAIATTPVGTLANPGAYGTVIDNNDSIIWNPVADKSGVAKFYSYKFSGLGWGPVGSPGGTTGLGCPGSMVFFGSSLPLTSVIFSLKVVGTYLLDNRI